MSLVKLRPKTQAVAPLRQCSSTTCCTDFSEQEHVMFHALEEDVDTALKATRPILSILPRRGQVHFYILPDQCDQRREFAHGRHVSALSLTKEELALSLPVVGKVLKRVGASRGVRINGLESKSSPALTYFTYHIDLEAA